MKQGTIIDATLISAPSSTKNKTGERDPEMHQTKKGNQWYFGMKVHIGVDKDSGLIHSVETTSANVHDITRAAQLLHGEEEVVYGDAGYQGIEKRAEIADKSITFRVAMRPGTNGECYPKPRMDTCWIWLKRLRLTSGPRLSTHFA